MAAGSFLTEKYGPLPGWGWAAVAGGGVIVYRLWKARQAGSSSGGSPSSLNVTAAPPATDPTAQVTTPGGFSYSGPLSGLQYAVPQGAMAATSNPTSSAQVNTFVPLTTNQAYTLSQGNPTQQVYYQSAPGIFSGIPVTSLTPTSPYGQVYLNAPAGYQAPAGTSTLPGVMAQ